MNSRILALALTITLCIGWGSARAQVPAILYFDLTWCPRPAELAELSKFMNITRNGCCIGQALVFAEYRSSGELQKRWDHRFSVRNNLNEACNGRVLTDAEQTADEEARRRALEQEAIAAEAAEKQRLIEEQREEAERRASTPKVLRALSKDDFCIAIGTAVRDSTVSGIGTYPELSNLVKKEATRRGLQLDYKLIAKENIRLDISDCQLLASWGSPERQNRSIGRWGVHIQHVYGGRSLVYTENGRVTSWQD